MSRRHNMIARLVAGATYREVGSAFGISHQRVQQIVAPPREVRELLAARAAGRCERCDQEKRLEAHHIRRGATVEGWDTKERFLSLCRSCHSKEHRETATAPAYGRRCEACGRLLAGFPGKRFHQKCKRRLQKRRERARQKQRQAGAGHAGVGRYHEREGEDGN